MILSSGSGLIINHTGVIVTNAHVVNIAATVPWRTELRVQLQNSDVYIGMVRDVDWKTDIATVKVNPQVEATGTSQTLSSEHVHDLGTANCANGEDCQGLWSKDFTVGLLLHKQSVSF